MTRRTRVVAIVAAVAAPALASGQRAVVREAGPGVAGRLLRDILAQPHTLIVAPDTGLVLSRGTDVPNTLVVIGGPVRLEGRVRGDFVVLGDLVLRPGATVDGRAITFGGVIANSALASVRGGRITFADVAFVATQTSAGQYALDYQQLDSRPLRTVTLPGVVGVHIPTYDRVDGLSAAYGPEIALAEGRIRIAPNATYRSQLGVVDPSVEVSWEPARRTTIAASASRGTFTNDAWMRGDLVNTVTTLFGGSDARNYYRADRADLTIGRRYETTSAIITPYFGARVERAWSARRDSTGSRPWSLFAKDEAEEGMRRPNPGVTGGSIGSGLAGVGARVLAGPITAAGALGAEVPVQTTNDARFVQLTLDGHVGFPTFGTQTLDVFAHAVTTLGDRPPSQRYAYIGGVSTIPTLLLLARGGDQLAWVEERYAIPLPSIRLPFVGSPRVILRHLVGGAGVDKLPVLTQNVGVRVTLGGLRFDYMLDPSDPKRHDVGVGFGLR